MYDFQVENLLSSKTYIFQFAISIPGVRGMHLKQTEKANQTNPHQRKQSKKNKKKQNKTTQRRQTKAKQTNQNNTKQKETKQHNTSSVCDLCGHVMEKNIW